MAEGRRVAVWISPGQTALARAVADAAGLDLIAAGSPARGQSQAVAAELGTSPADDLRAMLASIEADLVWVAAPGLFGGAAGGGDAEAVLAAHARGFTVATLEPVPASALDLMSGRWLEGEHGRCPADVVRFLPMPRDGSPFRQAAEVLETFGHIRSIAVETWGQPSEGTLGARVFGGLALIASLMGEPEKIDAAYVAPSHGTGVHALPGETLRDLSGDLTACMRFADGRAAGLAASDRGGRWARTVTLLGPAGRLRIDDDGFEWIGPDGARLDEMRLERSETPPAVRAIAEGLSRLLDPSAPEPPPLDYATVLSMGQAALLSARTGEAESPGTIRRMVGAE